MADLVIINGRVVTPGGIIYGGVAVEGSRITHVGDTSALPKGRRVLDARDQYVIPGLIDPHVHMGDVQGPPEVVDVETEGAVHGGVTTYGHFVATPDKPLAPGVEKSIRLLEGSSRVDFFIHGVIGGSDHLEEQPLVWAMGVTSFKHFFDAHKHRPGVEAPTPFRPLDPGQLYRSLEFIASRGYPGIAMAHCEDIEIIDFLERRLREQGRKDLLAWTEARPSLVEYVRIMFASELAKATGAPLYIVHVSTAEGVDFIAEQRRLGYPIWGETGPQWLTHTGEMEEQVGCWGKVKSSLKYPRDRDRLWSGIKDGGITNLGTDHVTRGRRADEREQGGGKHQNIWRAYAGMPGGLEHLLPVVMTFGVHAGRITIEDLVRIGSYDTARVFGLYPKKGVLAPGSDADIVIVDPEKEALVNGDFYHCLCGCSIYEGYRVKGMARVTILRGKVILEDFETAGQPGDGQYIALPLGK